MKLLYLVTQSDSGGAQKYVFELATSLAKDFEITVACGGHGELIDKLKNAGVKVKIFKNLVREISPVKDVACFFQLIKFIRREKFDVVHTNSSKAEILGNLAAKLAGVKKIIFTAHGFVFNEPLSKFRKRIYLCLEKFASFFATKIICVSEAERQAAIGVKLCRVDKLITIHNGLDFEKFNESFSTSHDKRAELGLTAENFVIGTVANFYATKGLTYLIEAFAQVYVKFSQARLVIVGDGILRKKIESLIESLGLRKVVTLAGFQPEIYGYLKTFDLFVLSSVKEGFGYALIEAQAAGLAVVASKVGGIPEIITDRQTGLLVEPANSQALAEAILTLIENKSLRQATAEAGPNSVKKNFSLANSIAKTKALYEK